MMHLAAYTSSIATGSVLLQVTQLADPIIPPLNNGFQVMPAVPNLMGAAAIGTNLTRFQLTSGSIRKMFPWDFEPVNVGTAVESPTRWFDFTKMPVALDLNEELDAYAVQSNAGSEQVYVLAWFCDGPVSPATGRIQTLHATATTTLTAKVWTACALTLDNGLDGGTYAIVGAYGFSATALAFRFVPRGGGSAFRPGGFAGQARDYQMPRGQRYGGWGTWMTFANTAIPQVEFLATSADTAEEIFFDLIKVG